MTVLEGRYPISRLPVCPRCEGLAMWGHGGQGICTKCGTIDRDPVTLSEYMTKGYDIDQTGITRHEKEDLKNRIFYLPDY